MLSVEIVASQVPNTVFATSPPTDTSRLFLVQQHGLVSVVRDGQLVAEPFLDIRPLISDVSDQGRGLLSLAFDPEYDETRALFVSYTNTDGDSQIDRFRVTTDPDVADPSSRAPVLTVEQPIGDHNGGHIAFGPDGHLYVGLGDGGSGEARGNAQNLTSLLGAVLRLDVTALPFSIPSTNPFQAPARAEIWAYGLRNPWRWSFDPENGDLYVADVGETNWEEINIVSSDDGGGHNFGWSIMEGSRCFEAPECPAVGLVLPAVEYSHDEGCGVIGGYVYRGSHLLSLTGHFLYGDFCAGWVRSFRVTDGAAVQHREWRLQPEGIVQNIVSFGRDARGELYIVGLDGTVVRIVEAGR